ncbi:MAG: hypothetical protein CBC06_004430 [bacterium TMED46]|nr:MAG: hypothetical protein CBC06_004430 [bacterium TMED46]
MKWYYTCNDKKFSSKVKALEENIDTAKGVFFHANPSWNDFNFSIDPDMDWRNLLRQEAKYIRDTYTYIRIWYSGGSDSHLVLQSFADNNIFVDEIVCMKSGIGDADYEINQYAIEQIKKYNLINTKVTIIDPTVNDYVDYYTKDWSKKDIPEWNYHFRMIYHNKLSQDEHRKDKTINVFGAEPPRLIHKNNHWYMYFLDADIEESYNKYNFFVENPILHAKQCHMLLKAIKQYKTVNEYNEICHTPKHEKFCREHTGRFSNPYVFPRKIEYWGDKERNYLMLGDRKIYFTSKKESNALQIILKDAPELLKKWHEGLEQMFHFESWRNYGASELGTLGVLTKFYSLQDESVRTVDELFPKGFNV